MRETDIFGYQCTNCKAVNPKTLKFFLGIVIVLFVLIVFGNPSDKNDPVLLAQEVLGSPDTSVSKGFLAGEYDDKSKDLSIVYRFSLDSPHSENLSPLQEVDITLIPLLREIYRLDPYIQKIVMLLAVPWVGDTSQGHVEINTSNLYNKNFSWKPWIFIQMSRQESNSIKTEMHPGKLSWLLLDLYYPGIYIYLPELRKFQQLENSLK